MPIMMRSWGNGDTNQSSNQFNTNKQTMTNDEIRKSFTVRGLSGLKNIGNTCYMNSTLQCLSAIPIFCAYLRKQNFINRLQTNILENLKKKIIEKYTISDGEIININQNDLIEEYKNTIVYRLSELLSVMWEKNGTITPKSFKELIGKKNEMFKGFDQNDSQELLNTILDTIHEEIKCEVTIEFKNISPNLLDFIKVKQDCTKIIHDKNTSQEEKQRAYNYFNQYKFTHQKEVAEMSSITYWKKYIQSSHSIITDLFTGLFHSVTICQECKNVTHSFEPFNILSVPTKDDGEDSLMDCLKEFCKEEKLDGDNKYNCERCDKKVNAIKKISIWEPPEILIIQLKRFKNDYYRTSKTNSKVVFPLEGLTLDNFYSEYHEVNEVKYDLYGISQHYGSCMGGHYIAYTKNGLSNLWYEFNDNTVTHYPKEKIEDAVVTKNAYILFYVRRH